MPADSIPRSILVICLIISAGFFSGSETALSYCNNIRIRMLAEEGDKRAKRVVHMLDSFDMTIVTLLIAVNIISVIAAAVATLLAVDLMGSGGSVVATIVLTLAVFLFSETVPKNIARTNSDAYILGVSFWLILFKYLLTPVAVIFTLMGTAVKKHVKVTNSQPSVTEDEFASMVEGVEDDGLIEPEETEIIKSAIEFGDLVAFEVMTPREDVVGIPANANVEAVKKILVDEKYSRFPVYKDSIDNIIGVLQSADSLWKLVNGMKFKITENITKPYFVRPITPLYEVFEGMGGRNTHLAIVRSNEGKTLGILTMEDILEEIVGEIYDEYDDEPLPEPEVTEGGGSDE